MESFQRAEDMNDGDVFKYRNTFLSSDPNDVFIGKVFHDSYTNTKRFMLFDARSIDGLSKADYRVFDRMKKTDFVEFVMT